MAKQSIKTTTKKTTAKKSTGKTVPLKEYKPKNKTVPLKEYKAPTSITKKRAATKKPTGTNKRTKRAWAEYM